MRSRFFPLLLAGLLAAGAATTAAGPSASAATMRYASIADLTHASAAVVVGTLVDARVFEGDMGQTTTEWTVQIVETWRGDTSKETLTFQQWGGTLNGRTSYIPGDPQFTLGQTGVFFLHQPEGEPMALTAMRQSFFALGAQDLTNLGELEGSLLPTDGVAPPTLQDLTVSSVSPMPRVRTGSRSFEGIVIYDDHGHIAHRDQETWTIAALRQQVRLATEEGAQ